MLLETLFVLTQSTPEYSELKTNPASIVLELPAVRNEFRLAQESKPETLKQKTQTIEIPDGLYNSIKVNNYFFTK